MFYFVNKLDLNYRKYQTNGNVRDENHNVKFPFPVKDIVSFATCCLSIFLCQPDS